MQSQPLCLLTLGHPGHLCQCLSAPPFLSCPRPGAPGRGWWHPLAPFMACRPGLSAGRAPHSGQGTLAQEHLHLGSDEHRGAKCLPSPHPGQSSSPRREVWTLPAQTCPQAWLLRSHPHPPPSKHHALVPLGRLLPPGHLSSSGDN